ncbi:hypothetical protein [cyanobacterium endosymbiont of Epithemia turgida]|nr:hypothetical protein [cyanobacterium endosymbiont of Epithemia turgida]
MGFRYDDVASRPMISVDLLFSFSRGAQKKASGGFEDTNLKENRVL